MLTTLAHAGHGTTEGQSLLHYLIEPSHLPFTVAAATVIVVGASWAFRKARRNARKR